MLHQKIVKIQIIISTVFFVLCNLKLRLHIGLTTVLTILYFNITKSTKHASNPFPCMSSMLFSFLNFYHDLYQVINCIFKIVTNGNLIFLLKPFLSSPLTLPWLRLLFKAPR